MLASFTTVCGQTIQIYRGAEDGSAAAAIDNSLFAAASDEVNVIRVYRRDAGGAPLREVDLNEFLKPKSRSPETDIEAAARIGNRIYWVTSHGRDKKGRDQPSRCRFFATEIKTNSAGITLSPVGKPYQDLREDLIAAPQLKQFGLKEAATRAPKDPDALNIEGLAAMPNGHLLIGFRNPIPGGRALLVPLLNPEGMIDGKRARLGDPILLGLQGLGVRDMAMWQGEYLIVAGRIAAGGPFKLFRWAGGDAKPAALEGIDLKKLHPEAVVIYPDKGLREFQLLSDDDSLPENQATTASDKKTFRGMWVAP